MNRTMVKETDEQHSLLVMITPLTAVAGIVPNKPVNRLLYGMCEKTIKGLTLATKHFCGGSLDCELVA